MKSNIMFEIFPITLKNGFLFIHELMNKYKLFNHLFTFGPTQNEAHLP